MQCRGRQGPYRAGAATQEVGRGYRKSAGETRASAGRSQRSPLQEWREVNSVRGIPPSGTIMAQPQSCRQGEDARHPAVRLPAKADRRITTPQEAMPSADRQAGTEAVSQCGRSAYATRIPARFPGRSSTQTGPTSNAGQPSRRRCRGFAVVGTVARGISSSRGSGLSGRPIPLQRLMSLIAKDAHPARSWFDPRAACSMA